MSGSHPVSVRHGQRTSQTGRRALGTSKLSRRGRSAAEWTSFAASALIVVGLIAALTTLRFSGSAEPTVLDVQLTPRLARREPNGYYVPVRLINRGERAVEEVQVRLMLETSRGRQYTAELATPFLAGRARRDATVVFPEDPGSGRLGVDSLSYAQP